MGPTVGGGPAAGFASDPDELAGVVDGITSFIAEQVSETGRSGVAVEISGGLNSAVATMLAADALGAGRVFGLLLPAYMSTEADALTAELVAKGLEIEYSKVQLLPFVHLFHELSVPEEDDPHDADATANAIDRMRMACTYYAAETTNRLVLGTESRTEWLLGTVTKYGVRRGDLLPLGDLYETEVRNVADHIGIPRGVYDSPEVWTGPTVVPEIDADPMTVDAILRHLVDEDEGIDGTADDLGVDSDVVRTLAEQHVRSRDQRTLPPTPETADVDRYDRFHEIELKFD